VTHCRFGTSRRRGEVKEKGTLGYIDTTMATPELNGFMQG